MNNFRTPDQPDLANDMRQASAADVIDIIELLEESSAWMVSIGIDRWQPGVHAAGEQQLRNEVKSGTVYVWKPANVLFATIRVKETDDAIWPNESTTALYIHKMSVRRSLKGRGFGKLLLQWAEQRATRCGVERLRLDCWAENQRLCNFYLSCGFQPIRTTTVQGWTHQLFERRVSEDSSLVTGSSMRYHVREMQLGETSTMIRYFLNADLRFLKGMGVDPKKLPTESAWSELLHQDFARPIQQKQFYYLLWLVDNAPIGHCNINKIAFGQSAFMHLHIWDADNRRSGSATQLLKPSILTFFQQFQLRELYCEPYALNPAPNKALPKVGFQLVKTYETTPGWVNFFQPVNLWKLDREMALRDAPDFNAYLQQQHNKDV